MVVEAQVTLQRFKTEAEVLTAAVIVKSARITRGRRDSQRPILYFTSIMDPSFLYTKQITVL